MRDENQTDGISSLCLLSQGTPILLTGVAGATVLQEIIVPARLMGPHTGFRIDMLWSVNNTVANKYVAVKFDGVTVGPSHNLVSTVTGQLLLKGNNRGAKNSQVWNTFLQAPYGTTTVSVYTSAIDFSVDRVLQVVGNLTNPADQMTLEAVTVELLGTAPN